MEWNVWDGKQNLVEPISALLQFLQPETNIPVVPQIPQIDSHLSESITQTKAWWIKVKLHAVPAVLCRGDGNERRSSQGEAGGSRLCRLCLWPSLTVVLLSLAEGQWRQLYTATREPPYCKRLQAGERTSIRRQGGVRHLSKKKVRVGDL